MTAQTLPCVTLCCYLYKRKLLFLFKQKVLYKVNGFILFTNNTRMYSSCTYFFKFSAYFFEKSFFYTYTDIKDYFHVKIESFLTNE